MPYYFSEPCTRAIVKRKGTPSICEPSRCYRLGNDLIFFVSYFEGILVKHHVCGIEKKKDKLNTRF